MIIITIQTIARTISIGSVMGTLMPKNLIMINAPAAMQSIERTTIIISAKSPLIRLVTPLRISPSGKKVLPVRPRIPVAKRYKATAMFNKIRPILLFIFNSFKCFLTPTEFYSVILSIRAAIVNAFVCLL
jgi:hypothetical protein